VLRQLLINFVDYHYEVKMMNSKKNKKINMLISLFLVTIISLESFAVAVSDNDGSAFISKAEFDSLKNNFQSQIDQYNTSIDSKIDEAIASYISGIRVSKENKVTLICDIDTEIGKGYRARVGDIQATGSGGDPALVMNNRDTAEWILGNTSSVCFRGQLGWKDIDNGEVHSIYSNEDLTSKFLPEGTTSPWYVPQGSWGIVRVTNGDWATPPVGTSLVSGATTLKRKSVPMPYVDKNGVVQELSNTRPIIIDMRGVRGRTGATSTDRWFGLAGVKKGEKPAQKIFEINELIDDLPIICYNAQDTEGAAGFGYVYAVKKDATVHNNPNIFAWNPTVVCTAYDSDCKEILVRGEIASAALNGDYSFSYTVNRIAWGQSASGGRTFNTTNTGVPMASFIPAEAHTNLPDDAFVAETGFDFKRMKLKYMQLKDFKSITDPSRNLYVYEGLPIYTAERDGTLTFDIKITKSKRTTEGVDAATYILWDDPSENMKIRVKDKPFNINDDYSECINIKIGDVESKEGAITADTVTTVKFDIKKGKTYYMQWYCEGYNYGGEITYMGNAVETTID
jgi:hypothetical protein